MIIAKQRWLGSFSDLKQEKSTKSSSMLKDFVQRQFQPEKSAI